jgi:hypothetical protein
MGLQEPAGMFLSLRDLKGMFEADEGPFWAGPKAKFPIGYSVWKQRLEGLGGMLGFS